MIIITITVKIMMTKVMTSMTKTIILWLCWMIIESQKQCVGRCRLELIYRRLAGTEISYSVERPLLAVRPIFMDGWYIEHCSRGPNRSTSYSGTGYCSVAYCSTAYCSAGYCSTWWYIEHCSTPLSCPYCQPGQCPFLICIGWIFTENLATKVNGYHSKEKQLILM